MIRYLLDTNIVSESARPAANPNVLKHLRRHGYEVAIASITWHELLYGVERLPKGRKRTYLADFLTSVIYPAFPVLPYAEAAAQWHAHERARLESIGRSAAFVDGQIASIAATRGLILVTRNQDDFKDFDGLHLENWFVK